MPQVVAESSSEAVFIASRLQEQDAQLAQHAEDTADGPLLAHAHDTDSGDETAGASTGDVADPKGSRGYNASTGALTAADQSGESEEVAAEEDDGEEWHHDSTDHLQAAAAGAAVPGDPDEVENGAQGAAGGKVKPKFRLLSPLIAVRMTGERRCCSAGRLHVEY